MINATSCMPALPYKYVHICTPCPPCPRFTHFALEPSSPILVQAVFLTRPFPVLAAVFLPPVDKNDSPTLPPLHPALWYTPCLVGIGRWDGSNGTVNGRIAWRSYR